MKLDITNPCILQTDFYQLTMVVAYLTEDRANMTAGFECFYRHMKRSIAPVGDAFVFSGESRVHGYMAAVRKEVTNPGLLQVFLRAVTPRLHPSNRDDVLAKIAEMWPKLRTDFEYWVLPEGSYCHPLVPVVQYRGPIWIGQLIETSICQLVNSASGLATVKKHISEGI